MTCVWPNVFWLLTSYLLFLFVHLEIKMSFGATLRLDSSVVEQLLNSDSLSSDRSIFSSRNSWHACSLFSTSTSSMTDSTSVCKIQSYLGSGKQGWTQVQFGEKNCTIQLDHCVKDLCLSSREVTIQLARDELPHQVPSSIFSDMEVVSGASHLKFTQRGFSFKPDSPKVVLRYSTYTCAEFYSYRGRVERQLCEDSIEAITSLEYGMANDIMC
mmetsp:Transcript_11165/g.15204  ORF Transcript_11165/g.15204 Transcript_11165/m.15204 type:complete len:214 (+) Transcript_11165:155-796(+)